jgi:tellurite methyltransferase
MGNPWAREYLRTPDEYIWGTEPSAFAREVSALVRAHGRVLDLGCGEGRDSVFFAAQGFEVTGVEISLAGLRKAARLARARGVEVRWVCADVGHLPLAGPYDLVYSCGSIHFVRRAERRALLQGLKALTARDGHHAHVVFTDRAVYVEKGEVIDYFAPGELSAGYADWSILEREDGLITCAQDGTPHHHSVERLVARAATPVPLTPLRAGA